MCYGEGSEGFRRDITSGLEKFEIYVSFPYPQNHFTSQTESSIHPIPTNLKFVGGSTDNYVTRLQM